MDQNKTPSNYIIRKTDDTKIKITLYKGSKLDREYSIPTLSFIYLNETSEYLSSRLNDVTPKQVEQYISMSMKKGKRVTIKNTKYSIFGK